VNGLAPPEQARIDVVEQRPQVAQAVLDRGAGQHDARLGLELLGGAALARARILDRLGLVEDGQAPGGRDHPGQPVQRTVAGDHQIGAGELVGGRGGQALGGNARGMGDQHAERWREAGDLLRPVGEQRCRSDQQARHPAVLALEHHEQGDDLDGLAQAHVIGQAGAQAKTRQQMQPAHADLLVGAQGGPQLGTGAHHGEAIRATQARQGLGHPRPGDHLRPISLRSRLGGGLGCAGAREQAHGLVEAQALALGQLLHLAEMRDGLLQPLAVDLHPAAPDQHQALAGLQQLRHLGWGQRLAVQGHRDAEVEQGVQADGGGRGGADRGRNPRACRAAAPPAGGHTHHETCLLELRRVLEEAQRLRRGPAQRMVDRPLIDQRLQPRALLGCPLEGLEQPE
jgi:hypothetical protein